MCGYVFWTAIPRRKAPASGGIYTPTRGIVRENRLKNCSPWWWWLTVSWYSISIFCTNKEEQSLFFCSVHWRAWRQVGCRHSSNGCCYVHGTGVIDPIIAWQRVARAWWFVAAWIRIRVVDDASCSYCVLDGRWGDGVGARWMAGHDTVHIGNADTNVILCNCCSVRNFQNAVFVTESKGCCNECRVSERQQD